MTIPPDLLDCFIIREAPLIVNRTRSEYGSHQIASLEWWVEDSLLPLVDMLRGMYDYYVSQLDTLGWTLEELNDYIDELFFEYYHSLSTEISTDENYVLEGSFTPFTKNDLYVESIGSEMASCMWGVEGLNNEASVVFAGNSLGEAGYQVDYFIGGSDFYEDAWPTDITISGSTKLRYFFGIGNEYLKETYIKRNIVRVVGLDLDKFKKYLLPEVYANNPSLTCMVQYAPKTVTYIPQNNVGVGFLTLDYLRQSIAWYLENQLVDEESIKELVEGIIENIETGTPVMPGVTLIRENSALPVVWMKDLHFINTCTDQIRTYVHNIQTVMHYDMASPATTVHRDEKLTINSSTSLNPCAETYINKGSDSDWGEAFILHKYAGWNNLFQNTDSSNIILLDSEESVTLDVLDRIINPDVFRHYLAPTLYPYTACPLDPVVPVPANPKLKKGDVYKLLFTWTLPSGDPVQIDNLTITYQMRRIPSGELLTKKAVVQAGKYLEMKLDPGVTKDLPTGTHFWEIQCKWDEESVKTLFTGKVTVVEDITIGTELPIEP